MTPHEQTKSLILAELDKMQAENEKRIRAAMDKIKETAFAYMPYGMYSEFQDRVNDIVFTQLEIQL